MKKKIIVVTVVFLAVAAITAWALLRPSVPTIEKYESVDRPPALKPDYAGLVIPPNIAPLNFSLREPGTEFLVKVSSARGEPFEVYSRSGRIQFPIRKWRRLLAANKDGEIQYDIYIRDRQTPWRRFQTIANTIAAESIDSHIAYRLMRPQYNFYEVLGVYQRDLESFKESEVLHGRSYQNGCVNCHHFLKNDPDTMLLGIRSPIYGNAALYIHDGRVDKIGTVFGHTSWHPSGKAAAISRYDVRMFFHTARPDVQDVVEFDSMLAYYRFDTGRLNTNPKLADKAQLETQPTWSPDGKYLYFPSTPKLWAGDQTYPPVRYAEAKYDLKRISYDIETDQWGELETVLSSRQTGLSILTPRISPDGRFLLFCMCGYSCFALYQPDSDLYMMDLKTGDYHKLLCNSEFAESWHSWSLNSRWIIFSSKRDTGQFTRLYICYVDENGQTRKPFLLPQKDPDFYDSYLKLYNVPEFITGPITISNRALVQAVRSPQKMDVNAVTAATPKTDAQEAESWRMHRD